MLESDGIQMPAKVGAAIAAVMSDVPRLKKGEKNQHGNYSFASIDDFLDAVRPLCAKAGLIILQDEESCEMRDDWLVMRFRYTIGHVSGETWGHRPARTIMVSRKMGSQAFGAAQSYALKQFMRSLFQIATGDKGQDADEHPPAELPTEADGWFERGKRLKEQLEKAPTVADVERIMKESATTLAEIKEKSEARYHQLVKLSNERQVAIIQQTSKAA